VDWILVTRWAKPLLPGLLFINVYVPLHSGATNDDLNHLPNTVRELQRSYPGDTIVMGGDFNLDPWRCQERRAAQVPMTPQTRYLESLIAVLSNSFNRFPCHRAATYAENRGSSSLDHWFVLLVKTKFIFFLTKFKNYSS
jgi:hypothetical protein